MRVIIKKDGTPEVAAMTLVACYAEGKCADPKLKDDVEIVLSMEQAEALTNWLNRKVFGILLRKAE